jgi:large subunit ribosomal protein L22
MVHASLKNYRQSPRKVRVVANMVKGKSVKDAVAIFDLAAKRATGPLKALILSAAANAKHNFNLDAEGLVVKEIRVDAGYVLKRRLPRARGSASPIHKRTSHVLLTLAPAPEKKAKKGKKAAKAKITTKAEATK